MIFLRVRACVPTMHYYHRVSLPFQLKSIFWGEQNSLPLLKVITFCLKYLMDEALAEINRSQIVALRAHEVKWILTGHSMFSHLPHICVASP